MMFFPCVLDFDNILEHPFTIHTQYCVCKTEIQEIDSECHQQLHIYGPKATSFRLSNKLFANNIIGALIKEYPQ